MTTAPVPSSQSTEDIDLLLLLERSILFFKKYKWVFGTAILLGLAFGYFTWLKSPRIYKSRLIVHSTTLSNQDFIQIIDNWNNMLKSGKIALAKELNCPVNLLRNVKKLKASEIQKVFTANNPNGFYIDVLVKENAVLDDLQTAIIHGFENTDFVKKQLSIRKSNLLAMIDMVEIEIRKLDSTKKTVENILTNGGNRSSSVIIDISGLNRQKIEMNEKLLGYKQDLSMISAVQVLQGFSKFDNPAGPRLFVLLAVGLLSFLAIAYIIALFSSINAKLKARKISINNG